MYHTFYHTSYHTMLRNGDQVQMWVPTATRDVFKQIASATGESQMEVAKRLAESERKRVERQQARAGQK